MKLLVEIPDHHYENIKNLDSVILGRMPYKGIIMYSINAIKRAKPFPEADFLGNNAGEILDKIRAEFKELHDSWHKDGYYDEADALAYAMKVIDKYKAECEAEDGNETI